MLKINSIKKSYLLFSLATLSIILHNAFYGLFKIEEPVFFVLTFAFIFGFAVSVTINTISYIRKGEPKDLWKIGFIGLFGLIGLLPQFSPGFFGLFGLFGFFGARSWKRTEKR